MFDNAPARVLNSSWHAVSALCAAYVIYIVVYFQTTWNVAGVESLYHPVTQSTESRNLVCRFGHVAAFIIALRQCCSPRVMCMIAIAESWMNLNVMVYLTPLWIVDGLARGWLPMEQSSASVAASDA